MKLEHLYLTPTERLHSLLQWAINADTEQEYWRRKKHFERYLQKMYKKAIKDKCKTPSAGSIQKGTDYGFNNR